MEKHGSRAAPFCGALRCGAQLSAPEVLSVPVGWVGAKIGGVGGSPFPQVDAAGWIPLR